MSASLCNFYFWNTKLSIFFFQEYEQKMWNVCRFLFVCFSKNIFYFSIYSMWDMQKLSGKLRENTFFSKRSMTTWFYKLFFNFFFQFLVPHHTIYGELWKSCKFWLLVFDGFTRFESLEKKKTHKNSMVSWCSLVSMQVS